ncbi:peptidoglycan DD-metalloendopeptidase family protein [Isachenkonia alkalipeptolytica]|uniref:LysM peptidoglycan-binding domain-containing protein n=1 Tax=Isachenkonia alkalipeptolytica TaxID=2565777 RepID=A0AA43XJP9_9CLOT|nr:peptidoglycan DD-metalloendopeptidase family protein [Isachenkonia alkalipeptolytica]NBG88103.1 LysM peptidoglycan-binding domain-containing protein [Isachenkonia alkalipeptolytica]
MGYFQKLRQQGKDKMEKSGAWLQKQRKTLKLTEKTNNIKRYIATTTAQTKEKIKGKKITLPQKGGVVLGIGFAVLLVVGVTLSSEGVPILEPTYEGYTVSVEDEEIGVVENREIVEQMVKDMEEDLRDRHDENIVVEEESLSFTKGEFKESETPLTELSVIEERILSSIDYHVEAYTIKVEGETLVKLRSEEEASKLLDKIKEDYTEEDKEYEEVAFNEEITIEEALVSLGEIQEEDNALKILQKGTDEEEVHEVAEGETISEIAKQYGLTSEDIEQANRHLEDLHMISIGDELNLIVPKPYITVRTVEHVEYTEEIDFETEYNDTDSMYEGDRKITQQGASGEKEISGYVIRENGRKIDMEIEEEKIIAEPVTRIVARGTAERPTTVATGSFSSPTRGRLTSGFGTRWGRMHNGIDVAGPTGTPVNAADAGQVEFAGYRGSYGNLVIINHENGYQTYYAHLNAINVSSGDRVHKGARIGSMGSTGRSTGPHLHFEVRRNGQPTNPLNFVNY